MKRRNYVTILFLLVVILMAIPTNVYAEGIAYNAEIDVKVLKTLCFIFALTILFFLDVFYKGKKEINELEKKLEREEANSRDKSFDLSRLGIRNDALSRWKRIALEIDPELEKKVVQKMKEET